MLGDLPWGWSAYNCGVYIGWVWREGGRLIVHSGGFVATHSNCVRFLAVPASSTSLPTSEGAASLGPSHPSPDGTLDTPPPLLSTPVPHPMSPEATSLSTQAQPSPGRVARSASDPTSCTSSEAGMDHLCSLGVPNLYGKCPLIVEAQSWILGGVIRTFEGKLG